MANQPSCVIYNTNKWRRNKVKRESRTYKLPKESCHLLIGPLVDQLIKQLHALNARVHHEENPQMKSNPSNRNN